MTIDRKAILPNQTGFTLVEIMITLVIMAIAAALVAPAIMSMAPSMELKNAAQNLYSDMQRAKILAVKENRNVGIRVGTAGYTVGEPFTDTNGDGLYTADPVEVFTDTDGDGSYTPEKVVLFATTYEYIGLGSGEIAANDWNNVPCTFPAAITFNSRGTANADSAFLEITPLPGADLKDYHNLSYAVTVVATGAIKIRKYNGSTPFATASWIQ